MKILITGGHISPALATRTLLQKHELLFVIREHAYEGDASLSFEYEAMKNSGLTYKTIAAGRLQRHFTLHTIPSLLRFPIGFLQSCAILLSYKPDVILSFGGYVAVPVCVAAFLFGVPIVTHEQTVRIGLANRIISKFAKKICVTFKESLRYFPKQKTVVTGNPLRKELFNPPAYPPFPLLDSNNLPILYVTGGSGGSHSINVLVLTVIEKLLANYTVIHQTGASSLFEDYNRALEIVQSLPVDLRKRYIVRKHVTVSELAWLYKNISLLIGRSGANTVYEILTFGIPSLLIPLGVSGNDEQEENAKLVESVGLGRVLLQEGLTGEKLFAQIYSMVNGIKKYKKQAKAAARVVATDSDIHIADVVERMAKNS